MSNIVTIALCGAGYRGLERYASYCQLYPEKARIVAVAEPRDWFRNETIKRHSLRNSKNVFLDWREMINQPKLSDAVIIATQDNDHAEPAIAFAKKGYHILLEKPMAPNEEDCRKIVKAVKENGVMLAICHVLRYSPYFRKLKEIIDSGNLGQVVTIRHVERVGFWHYAHSYVRGNWRNESISSPMILAKSCHDMDIMRYLAGSSCTKVVSFGRLSHFISANAPSQAAERCVDCIYGDDGCPYSAKKFYFDLLKKGVHDWPLNIITQEYSKESVNNALVNTNYGKCVYKSDNNVVDNQSVLLEFENGIIADFTMTAFTEEETRHTEILGSHGELIGDSKTILFNNFQTRESVRHNILPASSEGTLGGHLGGDFGIIDDFIKAVAHNNPSLIISDPEVSLESHLMAFAAERSRLSKSIESINREV
jgi:predicted dehydrogenase